MKIKLTFLNKYIPNIQGSLPALDSEGKILLSSDH